MKDLDFIMLATLGVSSPIFLGLFLGLILPEIHVHDFYIQTFCKVKSSDVVPRYCCSTTCNLGCTTNIFAPDCDNQVIPIAKNNEDEIKKA